MSENITIERKKPHFLTTEFKVQRDINEENNSGFDVLQMIKALSITAIASIAYLMLVKNKKRKKKDKEALAYEVW